MKQMDCDEVNIWHTWRVYEYITLVGEPQRKRLFEIPRCKQEDTIKVGLSVIDDKGVDWLKLTYVTL